MAGNETIADIILRWIVDKKSQKEAAQALKAIEQGAMGAGKSARSSSSDWRAYSEILGKSEAEINAVASALNGTGPAAQKASDTLAEWNKQLLQTQVAAQETGKSVQRMNGLLTGVGGFTLIRLGRDLQRAGQSILSPIQAFVDAQGETTALGGQWLDTTQRLEQSTQRIGAVMAQELLPTLEKAADLTEKVADLIEAHPELAKAAAGLGIGAIGLGGTLSALGNVGLAIGALKTLGILGKGGLVGGAGAFATSAAGAATGGIAAGGLGILGGFNLADYIRKNLGDPLTELFVHLSPLLGPAGITISAGAQLEDLINKIKALGGAAKDTSGAVDKEVKPTQAAVDAYIQYRQEEAQAEKDYGAQREQIVQDTVSKIADIEANYASQRAQIVAAYDTQTQNALDRYNQQRVQAAATFALNQAQAQETYYQNRMEMVQNYNEATQKAEEDHQLRIRQMQEESNLRISELIAARDALGIIRERRKAEKDRRDEEEKYQLDVRQRDRDFALKVKQAEAQFRLEQAHRAEDFALRQQQAAAQFALQQEVAKQQFEERLKQLDEQHQKELEQAKQAERDKLDELQKQYNDERIQRRNAFLDQIRDLQDTLLNERETRLAYYAAMEADLTAWLASMNGQFGTNLPPTETHQAGGYGPGYVGSGEFVLNRSTTAMLEQATGRKLTQGSIMQNGGTTFNISFPAGLVTVKHMQDYIGKQFDAFTKQVVGALA